MLNKILRFVYSFCIILLLLFFIGPLNSYAADIGNCLLCHKYPGLSRIDEDGNLRLLFVNEKVFYNSVHARV